MAAKISDDLVGVVYLNDGRVLKAGDEVPDDAKDQVGEHALAKGRATSTSKQAAKGDGGTSSGS